MEFLRKYIHIVICSIILLLVVILGSTKDKSIMPCFLLESSSGLEFQKITIFDANDGNYYVFLPSYVDLEQVKISVPEKNNYTIENTVLIDGMDCGGFALITPYTFSINSNKVGTLWFYQSENVGTIYIETATGTTRHIHEDKERTEGASIKVLRSDGILECYDELGTIKGRGNTTWNYHKKPYTIRFSEEKDLFDMGAATDWILLANAADGSHLNNKIIYDLANQVGDVWAPQCVYADLYLNGQYVGLYLLTEKVEQASGRLEIDTDADDFLCEFRGAADKSEEAYCVTTDSGRSAMILAPKQLDEARKNQIAILIKNMEQELLSGNNLSNSTIIDLDSWVRRYILDEISSNVDADRASCYFYYSNGQLYAGPIWDYDKGFGNCIQSRNPRSFTANNEKRSATFSLPYYAELYKNSSFQTRVCQLYAEEFLPLLNHLNNGALATMAQEIAKATEMDSLRWKGLSPDLQSTALIPTDGDSVVTYLRQKTEFLNSAWLDDVNYCTVQFELNSGAEYVNYAVEKGTVFSFESIDLEENVWVEVQSGEVFDFDQPITDDMIFHLQSASSLEPQTEEQASHSTAEILVVVSLILMGLLLLGMIGIDLNNRY